MSGLLNYISAPNIRNKVRHPLFLALRFPSCVKLFYNQFIFPANEKDKEFGEILIKRITSILEDSEPSTPREDSQSSERMAPNINARMAEDGPKAGHKDESGKWVFLENESNGGFILPHWIKRNTTQFLVLIESSEGSSGMPPGQWKRLNEYLEPVSSKSVAFVFDRSLINSNWFVKFENIEDVSQKYKRKFQSAYPRLSQTNEEDDSGEEDESMNGSSVTKKQGMEVEANDFEIVGMNYYPIARRENQFSMPRESMMSFVEPNEVLMEQSSSKDEKPETSSLLVKRQISSAKNEPKERQTNAKKANVEAEPSDVGETATGTSKNSDETEGSSKTSKNCDESSGSGSSKENNSSQNSPKDRSQIEKEQRKKFHEPKDSAKVASKEETKEKPSDFEPLPMPAVSVQPTEQPVSNPLEKNNAPTSKSLNEGVVQNPLPMNQNGQTINPLLLANAFKMASAFRVPSAQGSGSQTPLGGLDKTKQFVPAMNSLGQQGEVQSGFPLAYQQLLSRAYLGSLLENQGPKPGQLGSSQESELAQLMRAGFGGQGMTMPNFINETSNINNAAFFLSAFPNALKQGLMLNGINGGNGMMVPQYIPMQLLQGNSDIQRENQINNGFPVYQPQPKKYEEIKMNGQPFDPFK